jgi:hypothetical protein
MWTASRDIAFGLFVIVAIVFAFMIMFRVKLSPQTVISVQSALPKIIIALILVTFSYAIAGFLIDLMYVLIGLVSLLGSQFAQAALGFTISPAGIFNFLTLGQPVGAIVGNRIGQIGVFGLLLFYVFAFVLGFFAVLFMSVGAILFNIAGAIAALTIATAAITGPIAVIAGLIAIIIVLIVQIIVIWNCFKVLWMLIKAFANILLLTIFAPFQIAIGTVVPSLSFGNWLKSYISNLAIFVVTGAMILLMYIFLALGLHIGIGGSFGQIIVNFIFGSGTAQFVAGSQSQYWPPLLGIGNSNEGIGLLFLAVSFVIFTLVPKANELIQSIISGKPFAYGTAIGEAFGPVGGAAAGVGGYARKYATEGALGYGAGQVITRNTLTENDKGIRGLLFSVMNSLQSNANRRPYENPYSTKKR